MFRLLYNFVENLFYQTKNLSFASSVLMLLSKKRTKPRRSEWKKGTQRTAEWETCKAWEAPLRLNEKKQEAQSAQHPGCRFSLAYLFSYSQKYNNNNNDLS